MNTPSAAATMTSASVPYWVAWIVIRPALTGRGRRSGASRLRLIVVEPTLAACTFSVMVRTVFLGTAMTAGRLRTVSRLPGGKPILSRTLTA